MSQTIADSVIRDLQRTAGMITTLTYDDPTGEITADAYILNEIAELIDEIDWDIMRAHYLEGNKHENPSTE